MKFFMYSKCGEGAGLLKRIQDEGNTCSLFIAEKDYSSVYNGILKKSNVPSDGDIIIFDSSGMGDKADNFRRRGFKVFGASKFHDKLENDREFGLDFMWDHGIQIPETVTLTDFKQGIDFVKKYKDKRFVFKPSGKDLPTKLTYSCSDTEDMILYMQYVEENFANLIDDFVLQEFVEGALLSTEFWVGKKGFLEPVNHTIETKKLMNGDIGPSTGCSGNIVWMGDDGSEVSELLRGIEEDLIKEEYIGPIDLNAIINEKGVFGLEWTPRFGLDAMPTLLQLISTDVGKIISDSFDSIPTVEMLEYFSGGARLSIPPYPIEPENLKEIEKNSPNIGIPIRGLEDCEECCYFYEVMKKDDLLVHSAGTGVIACISALGNKPKSCFDIVDEMLEECKVPDKMYRTDLGEILTDMYNEVEEFLEVKV